MLKFVMIFLCTVFSVLLVAAEERAWGVEKSLGEGRMWVGKNGVGIRGEFIEREGDIIIVARSGTATLLRININNLNERTREWFELEWEKRNRTFSGETSGSQKKLALKSGEVVNLDKNKLLDTTGYESVVETKINRDLIPNFNQSDYGKKSSDCVPNSYAMFITWWHVQEVVKVKEKRDFIDTVDWLHKRLARYMGTKNNRGTSYDDVAEGLTKFFTKDVETKAAFTSEKIRDFRPETLSKYVKGGNCTVLSLSVYHGNKYHAGHAVALKELTETGGIKLHTWGVKMSGTLKKLPDTEVPMNHFRGRSRQKGSEKEEVISSYEIDFMNRTDLPDYFEEKEIRFLLEYRKQDGLNVLTPYLPIDVELELKVN